jgi:flagellin-like protein
LVVSSDILTNPKGGIKRKMKTLRKFRKNVKALSPVVASIILIAVTVAVSIAVAAWMGALTVGFMGSSSITVTNMNFGGTVATAGNYINVTMKNTGTKQVIISQVRVNNVGPYTVEGSVYNMTGTTSLNPGIKDQVLNINYVGWSAGNPYKIEFYDNNGQVVGTYQANAPGA